MLSTTSEILLGTAVCIVHTAIVIAIATSLTNGYQSFLWSYSQISKRTVVITQYEWFLVLLKVEFHCKLEKGCRASTQVSLPLDATQWRPERAIIKWNTRILSNYLTKPSEEKCRMILYFSVKIIAKCGSVNDKCLFFLTLCAKVPTIYSWVWKRRWLNMRCQHWLQKHFTKRMKLIHKIRQK